MNNNNLKFKFLLVTEDTLKEITEKDKVDYFNNLHNKYMTSYNNLDNEFVELEEYFHWINKGMDINLVYFTNIEGEIDILNFFTYTKKLESGKLKTYNLVDKKLPMEMIATPAHSNGLRFINNLIDLGYITDIEVEDINSSYLTEPYQVEINKLFYKEYLNFEKNLVLGYPEIKASEIKLYKKIYSFEEIILEVNNMQFECELLECLFAYEREKYFICAAGLGSVIEHLIYLTTYKHVTDEKDEYGKSKIIINENSTSHEYIAELRRAPFNADKREINLLKNIFSDRNSVSHYNKGHISKTMCDRLLEGLSIVFDTYYMFNNKDL